VGPSCKNGKRELNRPRLGPSDGRQGGVPHEPREAILPGAGARHVCCVVHLLASQGHTNASLATGFRCPPRDGPSPPPRGPFEVDRGPFWGSLRVTGARWSPSAWYKFTKGPRSTSKESPPKRTSIHLERRRLSLARLHRTYIFKQDATTLIRKRRSHDLTLTSRLFFSLARRMQCLSLFFSHLSVFVVTRTWHWLAPLCSRSLSLSHTHTHSLSLSLSLSLQDCS
jgi:hypothetical protein